MPIKLECPRCNTLLQVPSKKAGGYVTCPHCKGRVWVEKGQPPADAPPPSVNPMPSPLPPVVGPLPMSPPSVRPQPQPPEPPRPPAPRKKVARFIAAEAADSTLRLAADGKLPELHLDESETKEKPKAESSSNPLVLLIGLCVAGVFWGALIFSLLQTPSTPKSQRKDQMRALIEREYFGAGTIEDKSLAPYQVLLREAQRAHSRGDAKAERARYRKVLDMLRAERGVHERGLTGRRSRDKELEDAISVLLAN